MRFYLILLPFALALHLASVSGESTTHSRASNSSSTAAIPTATTKAVEKVTYPKKVTSLKKRPTKSSSILTATSTTPKPKKPTQLVSASFKNLTADDLEFIQELDKQFNIHGDKVKIKVERENNTDSKNSKRTIESELGYGHQPNGYEYPKPKFMFYPYSQQDIPAHAPGYHPKSEHSGITIEPSYSYELKPQVYQATEPPQIDLPAADPHAYEAAGHGADQGQQHYEEPVIVLRIPGPAKYASHLQTLLQQYLEIRAKQYLDILESSEHQQQHQAELQQHQHLEQQHQSHAVFEQHYSAPESQQYVTPQYEEPHFAAPQHVDYHQSAEMSYNAHAPQQPIQYPDIDDVYQHYKGRHQHEQHQHHHEQQQHEQQQHEQNQYEQQQQQHQQQHQPQHQQQHQEQHQHQLQQHQSQPVDYAPQYYQQESYAHVPAGAQEYADVPQYYYMHAQQYEQPGQAPQHYQQVFLVAMTPPVSQPIYEEPQEEQHASHEQHQQQQQHHHHQPIYVQDVAHQQQEQDHLPTSENNPRPTHTKVFFTHNSEQGAQDYSTMYALPSIRPHERHAPKITSSFQHYQNPQQQHVAESMASVEAASGVAEQHEQHETSAVGQSQDATPATSRPFNYHAHSVRGRRPRGHGKAAAATTKAVADPDEEFKRIGEVVATKLGAKKGHSTEFKTTELIKG